MRSVDGIGDTKDSCQKVEDLLLILGQILISTMGRGGNAFSVIAGQQSNEISLCSGKLLPRVFPNDSGRFLVMGSFVRGCGPADIVEEGTGDEEFQFGRF